MDFNTGTGGTGGSGGPGGNPAEPSGPRPSMASASGGDFNLQDPVQSFISTARAVALDPANFFRGIRRRGDFINPLGFALICAVINGVLTGIIGFLIGLTGDVGAGAAFGSLVSGVIGVPIATVIGLFIGAAIFHLLVMLIIRPNHEGYEATFRVGAYASVTQLVSWISIIPILGILVSLVVGLYSIFLGVVGIREMHSTTTGKAALVVLIPVAVGVFVALVLVAIIGAILFSALNSQ